MNEINESKYYLESKLDKDKDGDLDAKDFAMLREGAKKEMKSMKKEDKGDMDNDGKDEPDDEEYLQNKDKAIKKAMGKDVEETKGAPKGHYFTKSGNLVKGRLTQDAREKGARLSDPLDKQRSKAINHAENKQYDIAILDDGFQDFSVRPDFSILCFNSKQLIGNGLIIPSGPLREGLETVSYTHLTLPTNREV